MAVYQLPTGTYITRAALAVRGGSFRDRRHFAATAILVRHPKGDLLIDAGFGSDVAAHVASLPRIFAGIAAALIGYRRLSNSGRPSPS